MSCGFEGFQFGGAPKPAKYSMDQLRLIKEGVSKNGRAWAQYEVTSGPDAGRKILRGKPGVFESITKQQAESAFNSWYSLDRKKSDGSPAYKSAAGVARGKARDLAYGNKKVVSDSRYLRNPGLYDFDGVDLGTKSLNLTSAKYLASRAPERLAARAAKAKATRAAKKARSGSMAGGYYW